MHIARLAPRGFHTGVQLSDLLPFANLARPNLRRSAGGLADRRRSKRIRVRARNWRGGPEISVRVNVFRALPKRFDCSSFGAHVAEAGISIDVCGEGDMVRIRPDERRWRCFDPGGEIARKS